MNPNITEKINKSFNEKPRESSTQSCNTVELNNENINNLTDNTITYCSQKNCIKDGDGESDIIHEINIRLTGFGAIPHKKWDDRTTNAVKQFQKYYMKMTAPTGKVCLSTIRELDNFSGYFSANIENLKCPCVKNYGVIEEKYKSDEEGFNIIRQENKTLNISEESIFPKDDYGNKLCNGFGNNVVIHNKNGKVVTDQSEFPGIHRSLFWILKALNFFLLDSEIFKETHLNYNMGSITSGYRCKSDNRRHPALEPYNVKVGTIIRRRKRIINDKTEYYNEIKDKFKTTYRVKLDADKKVIFRASTNHHGKAIDVTFSDNTIDNPSINQKCEIHSNIRKKIMVKYMDATLGWKKNFIGLEYGQEDPGTPKASDWVHFDIREFKDCLEDKMFITTNDAINNTVNGENSLLEMIQKANHPILKCNEYLNPNLFV